VSEKDVATIARATTPNLDFHVLAIVLGFIAPTLAAFGYDERRLLTGHRDSAKSAHVAARAREYVA